MTGRVLRLALAVAALTCLTLSSSSWASDTAKEARWAEQVVDQLFDGEAVWLMADGTEFLGLYTEATVEDPKGSVVLLHGIGVHPDWPQVINPLRVGLAERGWHTLSIQMPVLPNEAAPEDYLPLLPEAPARIDAALRYVEEQHPSPVFLIAHSMGVTMATYYLGQKGDAPVAPVRGLVAIGAEAGGEGNLDPKAAQFARLQLPVLDLYGENDLVPVLSGADTRAAVAAAAGNLNYVQIEAPDADHFFNGFDPQLLEVVSAWLEQQR